MTSIPPDLFRRAAAQFNQALQRQLQSGPGGRQTGAGQRLSGRHKPGLVGGRCGRLARHAGRNAFIDGALAGLVAKPPRWLGC